MGIFKYIKGLANTISNNDIIPFFYDKKNKEYKGIKVSDFIAQIGAGTVNGYTQKVINLGVWNMDSNPDIDIEHGLSATEFDTIVDVRCMIFDDGNATLRPLNSVNTSGVLNGGIDRVTSTKVYLERVTGGQFDGIAHNDVVQNRGFCTITYIAD